MGRFFQKTIARVSYGVLMVVAFVLAVFTNGNNRDHSLRGMFTPGVSTAHADITVGSTGSNGGSAGDSDSSGSSGCTDGDCGADGSDCGGGCG